MQNGNSTIWTQLFFLAAFQLCGLSLTAQKTEQRRFDADYPSLKVDDECKSKSLRTPKPSIISISKKKLHEVHTVKDLVSEIPDQCEVKCAFIIVKKPEKKDFAFMNVGNDIVYYDRLPEGTYIIVDNLVSSCPQLHKANYRINIEP